MTQFPAFRSWRPSAALALLSCLLLSACGPFSFSVRSEHPAGVESVFVIFGPESDFDKKSSTAEVAPLVQPARLAQYYGYAEYAVTVVEGTTSWSKRSARLDTMQMEDPRVTQGHLAFGMPTGNLSSHPDLAIAVVVRTTDRQYRIKSWKHATIENAPGALEIDVASGEITANF